MMSEAQKIDALGPVIKYGSANIKKRCFVYSFGAVNVIVALILIVIGVQTPPRPSISLLSLTAATDTVATSTTTPTGGTFTVQNLTATFSISSRSNAAVIYSHFRVTSSQRGTSDRHYRSFISSPAATASVSSVVQSGRSNDTVEFRQPNATVVIPSWMGVRTGFSVLELELGLRARYEGKKLSVPMRTGWSYDGDNDLMAQILVSSQDSRPPELYFTGHFPVHYNVVSSPWDMVILCSSVWVGVLFGLCIYGWSESRSRTTPNSDHK